MHSPFSTRNRARFHLLDRATAHLKYFETTQWQLQTRRQQTENETAFASAFAFASEQALCHGTNSVGHRRATSCRRRHGCCTAAALIFTGGLRQPFHHSFIASPPNRDPSPHLPPPPPARPTQTDPQSVPQSHHSDRATHSAQRTL